MSFLQKPDLWFFLYYPLFNVVHTKLSVVHTKTLIFVPTLFPFLSSFSLVVNASMFTVTISSLPPDLTEEELVDHLRTLCPQHKVRSIVLWS